MPPLEAGNLDFGSLGISLSAAVLAKRKPYSGEQWPATGTAPAALAAPAPKRQYVRVAPTNAPAPATLSADDEGRALPDYCAPGFQKSLWLSKGSRTRQEAAGEANAPRPGLSLAGLAALRR